MSKYSLCILGRRSVLGADFTPAQLAGSLEMTPAQLADVDRKLSPAEQKRVDDWQAGASDATQKAEEAKGGPKATATITKTGGKVAAGPSDDAPPDDTWKKVLFAALAAALAVGGALLVGRAVK